jgi:hypothetical protein
MSRQRNKLRHFRTSQIMRVPCLFLTTTPPDVSSPMFLSCFSASLGNVFNGREAIGARGPERSLMRSPNTLLHGRLGSTRDIQTGPQRSCNVRGFGVVRSVTMSSCHRSAKDRFPMLGDAKSPEPSSYTPISTQPYPAGAFSYSSINHSTGSAAAPSYHSATNGCPRTAAQ